MGYKELFVHQLLEYINVTFVSIREILSSAFCMGLGYIACWTLLLVEVYVCVCVCLCACCVCVHLIMCVCTRVSVCVFGVLHLINVLTLL